MILKWSENGEGYRGRSIFFDLENFEIKTVGDLENEYYFTGGFYGKQYFISPREYSECCEILTYDIETMEVNQLSPFTLDDSNFDCSIQLILSMDTIILHCLSGSRENISFLTQDGSVNKIIEVDSYVSFINADYF